jgi:uncharacterized protein (DUF1800 family)
VLDILLAQPSASEYVTAKLWREFVSPDPDPREVKRIAQAFRGSNYDIKTAMRALLLCDAFWARENRGTLVKSPIEFVVGTLRQLEVQPQSGLPFAILSAGMGQNLYSPPNVKGWPGGNVWIDTNTLLARKQFVDRLARADEAPPPMAAAAMSQADAKAENAEKARARRLALLADRGMRNVQFDATRWLASRAGTTPEDKEHAAQTLLLALPPQTPPPPGDDALAFVRATLQDPVYQLK